MRAFLALFRAPRGLLVCASVFFAMALCAQPAPATSQAKPVQPPDPPPTKSLDTGESLGFMGKSLWFEVRRRLNLTTEAEEKKHKEETKEVKLKVGGLRVEKSAEVPPDPKKAAAQ